MSKSDIAKALSSNVDSPTETSLEPFRTSSKPFPSSPSGPGRRGYNIAEEQLLADDLADMRLADTLNKLTHDVPEFRYWGSSVGINLVKMTHDLKYANETKPLPQTPLYRKRSEFWSLQPVSLNMIPVYIPAILLVNSGKSRNGLGLRLVLLRCIFFQRTT